MASTIEALCTNFEKQLKIPWETSIAGPQRIWYAVYPPTNERRLRLRLDLFDAATTGAGRRWKHVDATGWFAQWMAKHPMRDDYFVNPEALRLGLIRFEAHIEQRLLAELQSPEVDSNTVVAVSGVGSLFGLASVSKLIAAVNGAVKGRLVVFFPGHRDKNNLLKLLDATAGYDYLGVVITADDGGIA